MAADKSTTGVLIGLAAVITALGSGGGDVILKLIGRGKSDAESTKAAPPSPSSPSPQQPSVAAVNEPSAKPAAVPAQPVAPPATQAAPALAPAAFPAARAAPAATPAALPVEAPEPPVEFTVIDRLQAYQVSEYLSISIDGKLAGTLLLDTTHPSAAVKLAVPKAGTHLYALDGFLTVRDAYGYAQQLRGSGQAAFEVTPGQTFTPGVARLGNAIRFSLHAAMREQQ